MDVETYIAGHQIHAELLNRLREIIMMHPFEESIKWGMPTYSFDSKNLVGIGAFKKHVGIWFFQGALLSDPEKMLHNAQEGKTKAMRQLHLYKAKDINEKVLKSYLQETIDNQKKGLSVKIPKKSEKLIIPEALSAAFREHKTTAKQFSAFPPGKQREYAEYIATAKREKTISDRLQKILPMIDQGKGLNDKYKKK